jgi:hypothetical protein
MRSARQIHSSSGSFASGRSGIRYSRLITDSVSSAKSDPLVEQKNLLGKVAKVPSVSPSSPYAPARKHSGAVEEKILKKSKQDPNPTSPRVTLAMARTLALSREASYFLPAIHNLRKIYRIKNRQGPFPGRTPVTGVITPSIIF